MAEIDPAESRMPMNGPLIAREGWLFVVIALVVAGGASYLLGLWSWPFWLIALFVLQFFRDPPRQPPAESTDGFTVLAPADGRIVALENVADPWLQRPTLKVSVFMNVFNVHANRSPVSGRVEQVWYHPGKFFNAALDKASLENERAALWLKTPQGYDVLSVQIAGLIARRVLSYAQKGDHLSRAQRYGFIRFGSRVDVYMDPRAQPKVALGDKVSAGVTVLALLPLSP